jgi:hypothetical protein
LLHVSGSFLTDTLLFGLVDSGPEIGLVLETDEGIIIFSQSTYS